MLPECRSSFGEVAAPQQKNKQTAAVHYIQNCTSRSNIASRVCNIFSCRTANGAPGGFDSKVLTKLSRIPSSVENTSATT
jgi:hypothetical protein